MKKLTEKAAKKLVEQAYYARCKNIEIPIWEISKIFKLGLAALAGGASQEELEEKIFAYVQTVRMSA